MKYLVEVERPIFLHFLNREAAAASGNVLDELRVIELINLLSVCHCSKLNVNISQMIEFSYGKKRLINVLSSLAKAGIIVTTSHDSGMGEFIASRQAMYSKVSSRYPMYFHDTSAVEGFRIAQANSFSMTTLLRRDILDMSGDQLTLLRRHAREDDLVDFRSNLTVLQDVAFRQRGEAITRANFELLANKDAISPSALDAVARVFSAWYFEHYVDKNALVTCTGIGDPGYLEDARHFPHYDIPILTQLLRALGWERLNLRPSAVRFELLGLYGTASHRTFVETLNAFLHACAAEASGDVLAGLDQVEAKRTVIINVASHLLRDLRDSTSLFDTLRAFFVAASENLHRAASRHLGTNERFKQAWEENVPPVAIARILVTTATDEEDKAIVPAITSSGFANEGAVSIGEGYAELYRRGNKNELIHVRSNAGSLGSNGSELVIAEAIKAFGIKFVLAVGVCFGMKEDKNNIGDVLFSESVQDYETVRLGVNETRERGPRMPAGTKLLSAAHIVRRGFDTAEHRVVGGLIVSGLKLVDDPNFRGELKARYPDAIGGDMEASGIMAAAHRSKVEWLMVKGICDWGMNKEGKDQPLAAGNASSVAMRIVDYVLDAETTRIIS